QELALATECSGANNGSAKNHFDDLLSGFMKKCQATNAIPEASNRSDVFLAFLAMATGSAAMAGRIHLLRGWKLSLLQRGQLDSSNTVSQSRQIRAFCIGINMTISLSTVLCLIITPSWKHQRGRREGMGTASRALRESLLSSS
ncbi:MAG: hypothetical protein IH935_07210, partial [Acidobacteria bacterium]|nr:hypothetical protein [Acidobacteriota bacterium]